MCVGQAELAGNPDRCGIARVDQRDDLVSPDMGKGELQYRRSGFGRQPQSPQVAAEELSGTMRRRLGAA